MQQKQSYLPSRTESLLLFSCPSFSAKYCLVRFLFSKTVSLSNKIWSLIRICLLWKDKFVALLAGCLVLPTLSFFFTKSFCLVFFDLPMNCFVEDKLLLNVDRQRRTTSSTVYFLKLIIYFFILTPVTPFVYLYLFLIFPKALKRIRHLVRQPSIYLDRNYKRFEVLEKASTLSTSCPGITTLYLKRMEYQRREGFCCPTTARNLIRSLRSLELDGNEGMLEGKLPPLISGARTALQLKQLLDDFTDSNLFKTSVVYGDEGYRTFLDTIKLSNSSSHRLAINFLRGALFGVSSSWPHSWLLAGLGGHFSNVLGYIEEDNLVVIFDVNHEYGVFVVDAHRLYESVNSPDISFSAVKSRALIVTELIK